MNPAHAPGPWPHVLPDQRTHVEMQELNTRFLELIRSLAAPMQGPGASPGRDVLGLAPEIAVRIGRLRPANLTDLARCPYALHGIALQDAAFWRELRPRDTPKRYRRSRTELRANDLNAVHDFLFLALAYGWHQASTNPIAARWMLGATAEELQRLTALPFGSLRQIAIDCPGLLRARLSDQRRFWEDLVAATESRSKQARFAAVSLGLQLSAAAGTTRPSEWGDHQGP
jgi:hypothetical protein